MHWLCFIKRYPFFIHNSSLTYLLNIFKLSHIITVSHIYTWYTAIVKFPIFYFWKEEFPLCPSGNNVNTYHYIHVSYLYPLKAQLIFNENSMIYFQNPHCMMLLCTYFLFFFRFLCHCMYDPWMGQGVPLVSACGFFPKSSKYFC